MKMVFIWPTAEYSTVDCANGLHRALLEAGHELVDYRMSRRWRVIGAGIGAHVPQGMEPKRDEIALYASEGFLYRAVAEQCRWAILVSPMGFHPNVLAAYRSVGGKVAVWYTEAPYDTNEGEELRFAPVTDVAFVNERAALDPFRREIEGRGIVEYLPHAYDPERHRPEGPVDEADRCDVLLVGTGFFDRIHLLRNVDWTGIDLRLGGTWQGVEEESFLRPFVKYPPMDNADTVRLYQGAKIVLNPHRFAPTVAESAGPRAYEAAACGAFQISDRRAEVEELFGASVPTYEAGVPWQLAGLIRRYLANDGERQALARQARERVAPHTFAARAEQVIAALERYDRLYDS